jgi:hypothetical protein
MFPDPVGSVVVGSSAVSPQVGIVPANAEPERTHVNARVAKNRFMVFGLLFFES